jgi:hypothetical protein
VGTGQLDCRPLRLLWCSCPQIRTPMLKATEWKRPRSNNPRAFKNDEENTQCNRHHTNTVSGTPQHRRSSARGRIRCNESSRGPAERDRFAAPPVDADTREHDRIVLGVPRSPSWTAGNCRIQHDPVRPRPRRRIGMPHRPSPHCAAGSGQAGPTVLCRGRGPPRHRDRQTVGRCRPANVR